jgi:hypothetical protein
MRVHDPPCCNARGADRQHASLSAQAYRIAAFACQKNDAPNARPTVNTWGWRTAENLEDRVSTRNVALEMFADSVCKSFCGEDETSRFSKGRRREPPSGCRGLPQR